MVSVRFSLVFWGLLLLAAQFQSGYSLFLGYKKDLIKHKLLKVKEALLSDPHDYEEVHHVHYKPYYVSSGSSGYSGYSGYSKWPSYSSYGWPSHSSGWHY